MKLTLYIYNYNFNRDYRCPENLAEIQCVFLPTPLQFHLQSFLLQKQMNAYAAALSHYFQIMNLPYHHQQPIVQAFRYGLYR